MAKTVTVDWASFMRGKVQSRESARLNIAIVQGFAIAATAAIMTNAVMPHEVQAVEVVAHPTGSVEDYVQPMAANQSADGIHFDADASWADYVVPLIRHQALPLAVTMVCWAGLEMILRRPSSALDRAKWAVGGYIGMQFAFPFLRHLGHQFGDA